jgi:hypothetical protein
MGQARARPHGVDQLAPCPFARRAALRLHGSGIAEVFFASPCLPGTVRLPRFERGEIEVWPVHV